jgi:hypothetical protein
MHGGRSSLRRQTHHFSKQYTTEPTHPKMLDASNHDAVVTSDSPRSLDPLVDIQLLHVVAMVPDVLGSGAPVRGNAMLL